MDYDVIIIGAGVVGGAVADILSDYSLSVLCLEKEADVCCGISKANTGIIHSPALIPEGTKKAEYAARSNPRFESLSSRLGFRFQRSGALVLGFTEGDRKKLEKYRAAGEKTWSRFGGSGEKMPEYRIIEKADLKKIEPGVSPGALFALLTPEAGRVIPYEYGIALWEKAVALGTRLKLNSAVKKIEKHQETGQTLWKIHTENETFSARFIINAAGHGSRELGQQAGFGDHQISRVNGQYLIIDRRKSPAINHVLFQVPAEGKSRLGKGILVTNTVYGNLMIGPDAGWLEGAEEGGTDLEALEKILEGARLSIPEISLKYTIRTFAGIRPKPLTDDFIIESSDGFINLCGIESPGLTSSPALAEDAVKLLVEQGLKLEKKEANHFKGKPVIEEILNLEMKETVRRSNLKEGDPEKLVCRCEQVPEERILNACRRGIPVTTLDGVKRRTRAGQGSCSGAYCGPKVRKIISEISGLPEKEITQRGGQPDYPRVPLSEIKKLS